MNLTVKYIKHSWPFVFVTLTYREHNYAHLHINLDVLKRFSVAI
jgi:hypothetical protein